jgi:site-specific DNA recombinase
MKLALYARVSTDKCEICGKKPAVHPKCGHEFRGQDPEVQLSELRDWCKAHKHTIAHEYVDRGISGTKASRPALDQLMADAEHGRRDFDAVVVWRLSRFGRSVRNLADQIGKLKEWKVGFISVQENFDLTQSIGRLVLNILSAIAEFERDVISENTIAGMKLAAKEGHVPGPKIDPKKGPSRWTVRRRRKKTEQAA